MKLRVLDKKTSKVVNSVDDLQIAAEMSIAIIKANPMNIGDPIAEISPGCPMGYAPPKVTLIYKTISPSIFDKVKLFITRKSLDDVIKNMKDDIK